MRGARGLRFAPHGKCREMGSQREPRPRFSSLSIGILCRARLPCQPMTREAAVVDSRQEILRAAARLFQQRGYDATSMNDVAATLKLSKGGLYHHFQSKD